jgi:DNA-binding CsgD family transcriptional regulator
VSASAIFSDSAWTAIGRTLRLTRRELEIVRKVLDDRKELAIASDLGLSAHTVHTHMQRLHNKLRVVDRVSLVMCIISEFFKLTLAFPPVLPPICAHRNAGKCPLREGAERRVKPSERSTRRIGPGSSHWAGC